LDSNIEKYWNNFRTYDTNSFIFERNPRNEFSWKDWHLLIIIKDYVLTINHKNIL
jgi:hypothetical protein